MVIGYKRANETKRKLKQWNAPWIWEAQKHQVEKHTHIYALRT